MFSLFLLAAVATFFVPVIRGHAPASCDGLPRDCESVWWFNREASDGPYWVCPGGLITGPVRVMCDMRGGGWTVILKRFDDSISFNRTWDEMKRQIGDFAGEFWMGLDFVQRITASGEYGLTVDIHEHWRSWTEIYNTFYLLDESQSYVVKAQQFNKAKSSIRHPNLGGYLHMNAPFSTYDRDIFGHNGICPAENGGPGWFNRYCSFFARPFAPFGAPRDGQWKSMWSITDHDYYRSYYPTSLRMKIRRETP